MGPAPKPSIKELWDQWHREWHACTGTAANAEARVLCTTKPDVYGKTWLELADCSRGRGWIDWNVTRRRDCVAKPPLNLYLASQSMIHAAPDHESTFAGCEFAEA